MPTFGHLSCSIELTATGQKLQEHVSLYGDGFVETFVAVPEEPQPFSIHLASNGYIAAGLAMYVFIDGVYQCNRNRRGLKNRRSGGKPLDHRTLIDFRVRQKEERQKGGLMLARNWTFEKLKIVSADDAPKSYAAELAVDIGCIEVLVLRCRGIRTDKNLGFDGANDRFDFNSGLGDRNQEWEHDDRDWQAEGRPNQSSRHETRGSGRTVPPTGFAYVHPQDVSRRPRHYDKQYHVQEPPSRGFEYGAGPIPRPHKHETDVDMFRDRTTSDISTNSPILNPTWLNKVLENAYIRGLDDQRKGNPDLALQPSNNDKSRHKSKAFHRHSALSLPPRYAPPVARSVLEDGKFGSPPNHPWRLTPQHNRNPDQHKVVNGAGWKQVHRPDTYLPNSNLGDWEWPPKKNTLDSWAESSTWASNGTQERESTKPISLGKFSTQQTPLVADLPHGKKHISPYNFRMQSRRASPSWSNHEEASIWDTTDDNGWDTTSEVGFESTMISPKAPIFNTWDSTDANGWETEDVRGEELDSLSSWSPIAVENVHQFHEKSARQSFRNKTPKEKSGQLPAPPAPTPMISAANGSNHSYESPPAFAVTMNEFLRGTHTIKDGTHVSLSKLPKPVVWEKVDETSQSSPNAEGTGARVSLDSWTWDTTESNLKRNCSSEERGDDRYSRQENAWQTTWSDVHDKKSMPGSWKNDIVANEDDRSVKRADMTSVREWNNLSNSKTNVGWNDDSLDSRKTSNIKFKNGRTGQKEKSVERGGERNDRQGASKVQELQETSWDNNDINASKNGTSQGSKLNNDESGWNYDSKPRADGDSGEANHGDSKKNDSGGGAWGTGFDTQVSDGQHDVSGGDGRSDNEGFDPKNSDNKQDDSNDAGSWNSGGFGTANKDKRGQQNWGIPAVYDVNNYKKSIKSVTNVRRTPSYHWLYPDLGPKSHWKFPPQPPPEILHYSNDEHESDVTGGKPKPWTVPEEPLHSIPESKVRKEGLEHQVRAGKGTQYTHNVGRPEYIDSLKKPYAVFRFKYRSRKFLKKEFGPEIPDFEPAASTLAGAFESTTKEKLRELSEEAKIAEILKLKAELKGAQEQKVASEKAPTLLLDWVGDQQARSKKSNSQKQDSPKASVKVAPNVGWGTDAWGNNQNNILKQAAPKASVGWDRKGQPGSQKAFTAKAAPNTVGNIGGWGDGWENPQGDGGETKGDSDDAGNGNWNQNNVGKGGDTVGDWNKDPEPQGNW